MNTRRLIQFCSSAACCIAMLSSPAYGQKNKPWAGFGIEANYLGGKGFKHTSKVKSDFPEYMPAFELNFVQQTYRRKAWQQRRHYPLLGFAIAYTIYDRDAIYGRSVSIYPNLQLPILTGKKLEWTAKAAFGIAYITRRYETAPGWDTLNTAIGSHVNNYSYFSTDLRYRLNQHLDIQCGINFAHASNAAFRQPNLGINKYGAHIGLRYFPVTSQPQRIYNTLPPLSNRYLLQMRLGIAGTEIAAADGPMYPVYLATLYGSKRYSSRNKVLLGVDYAFYNNVYRFLKNNEISIGEEAKHSWKSSVFAGNEFLMGRVGLVFQIGYYLKKNALSDYKIYEKLGGNLYLIQNEKGVLKELNTYIYLKTHSTQAELVEVGIGAGF